MTRKKSIYRVVPYEINGTDAWALKTGKVIIKTFISKQLAEVYKTNLETKLSNEFTK